MKTLLCEHRSYLYYTGFLHGLPTLDTLDDQCLSNSTMDLIKPGFFFKTRISWKSGFVETSYDDFWAPGLDKEATIHIRAFTWPGTNKLGSIMSEIAGRLRRSPGRSHSDSGPKTRTGSKEKSKTNQLQLSEIIYDIYKTQTSGSTCIKKASLASQFRDYNSRTAEG